MATTDETDPNPFYSQDTEDKEDSDDETDDEGAAGSDLSAELLTLITQATGKVTLNAIGVSPSNVLADLRHMVLFAPNLLIAIVAISVSFGCTTKKIANTELRSSLRKLKKVPKVFAGIGGCYKAFKICACLYHSALIAAVNISGEAVVQKAALDKTFSALGIAQMNIDALPSLSKTQTDKKKALSATKAAMTGMPVDPVFNAVISHFNSVTPTVYKGDAYGNFSTYQKGK